MRLYNNLNLNSYNKITTFHDLSVAVLSGNILSPNLALSITFFVIVPNDGCHGGPPRSVRVHPWTPREAALSPSVVICLTYVGSGSLRNSWQISSVARSSLLMGLSIIRVAVHFPGWSGHVFLITLSWHSLFLSAMPFLSGRHIFQIQCTSSELLAGMVFCPATSAAYYSVSRPLLREWVFGEGIHGSQKRP